MPFAQLLRGPLRDADVERLALADDVGEGLERLLERGLVVEAVRLVQVDVVGAEARERAVDRLEDVLAAQAGVVRSLGPVGK